MNRFTFLLLTFSFLCFQSFGQLSGTEVPQRKSGLSLELTNNQEIELFEPWEGIEIDIPSAISLEAFVPKVRSQEENENVGGWAVGYYLASTEWAMISNQSNKAMITAFAYDPIWMNSVGGSGDGCGGEVYLSDLMLSLSKNGIKRLNIDQSGCEVTTDFDKDWNLLDFQEPLRLTDSNRADSLNITSVKYALGGYHAVVFSMHIPESFQYVASDGLFRPSEDERNRTTVTTPHALTIVGFDDDLYGGAFRVVNSWGTDWGDDGYCWIRYEDFNAFQEAAYMMYTELKVPDLVAYGAEADGFGRKRIKKNGFFEGFLDAKGRPEKGIYMNEALKKGRGGSRYMKRLVKKHGGFLIYSEDNFKIPIAAVVY
ncbi:MAG: C1 family peptidase [bacterium]|nr:C1 family peptidase [bacterium]